jgi:Tol biopolymer transport system component
MSLAVGTRLDAYEIVAALGAGGMGEVYRAKDTKLGRDVALKILPASFTNDPERVARFRREAQVLASLNHPHIAQIHGLEEVNATQFLVLELVDGESLDKRIAHGPIPVDEALGIAKQIAEALEAAHEKGIIHRDLKPANIALTKDGQVKVLDFGLAKAVETTTGSSDAMNSPTITSPAMMTGVGVILGTAAYMAPEQAKGRASDKRSDLWAFGCVLYEMLTAKRAFRADDVSSTLAKVIEREPDWNALPAKTPAAVHRLLRRCLQKDHKRRLESSADARLEIDDALAGSPAETSVQARTFGWKPVLPWSLAAAALVLAFAFWRVGRSVAAVPRPVHLSVDLPELTSGGDVELGLAISPDGTHVAYAGNNRLYLQALDQAEAVAIAGSEIGGASGHARFPFFSPDNQWLAFWQWPDSKGSPVVKKVSVSGGVAITIGAIPMFGIAPRFEIGSWDASDEILMAGVGIGRISAAGGATVETLLALKPGDGGTAFPQVLPGGQWIMFDLAPIGSASGQVVIQSRATGERRVLLNDVEDARYVPPGYLVYERGRSLLAQGFDLERLQLTGRPTSLVDDVPQQDGGRQGNFAVSATGTLFYRSGLNRLTSSRLVSVRRDGTASTVEDVSGMVLYPRFSPDGSRLAYALVTGASDVWVRDLARGAETRLTFGGNNRFYPTWTRDGTKVTVSDQSSATNRILSVSADGSGRIEVLTDATARRFPTAWSPDGQTLAFYTNSSRTPPDRDIWMLHLDGSKRTATPFLETPFEEAAPIFSPDGRWVAYTSSKSGQNEIYARPYPGPGDEVTVSVGGAVEPVWAHSGRELFYRHEGKLIAVNVEETATSLKVGAPRTLFNDRYRLDTTGYVGGGANYDVSPDDQRFVMVGEPEAANAPKPVRLHIVLNWIEEVKTRVSTK